MDALSADLLLKRYLAQPRARDLLADGDPAASIKAVIPLAGVRSVIRVLEVNGQGRAVAKIYPPDEAPLARARIEADRLVELHRLAAPRVLDREEKDRSRAILLIEEYIDGAHPDPAALDGAPLLALADLFRRLHAIRSDRFGPVGAPPLRGSFADEAWRQARNRFRSIGRWSPPEITFFSRRAVKRWFRAYSRRFSRLESFSLVHDKPNLGNLLWRESSGDWATIDLATLRHGARAKDLAQVHHEILGDDPRKVAQFLERYFDDDARAREEYALQEPFYHAYHHLSQCAINCRRLHKVAGGRVDSPYDFSEKSLAHWRALQEIVSDETV